MTLRTLKDLAEEAYRVQDACNLCGVSQSFARAMLELRRILDSEGTDAWNTHPIAVLWADKIAHLAGTQSLADHNGQVAAAYSWLRTIGVQ